LEDHKIEPYNIDHRLKYTLTDKNIKLHKIGNGLRL